MDVQATEAAIEMLEGLAERRKGNQVYRQGVALYPAPTTVGRAVLESAAYRLRVHLREYLTRGRK